MNKDPLQERLERLRRLSNSAEFRSTLYGDMAGVGSHSAFSSLRPLRHVSAPGKKMQKLGLVMICIPEPTGVTCAVGAPLVLAGRYVERKYNSATVHDIGQETTKTIATIRNFKSNIM